MVGKAPKNRAEAGAVQGRKQCGLIVGKGLGAILRAFLARLEQKIG